MTVKLDVKYSLGHSYPERWKRDTYYCPNCGKQNVWSEQGEGDYYYGPSSLCVDCGFSFCLNCEGMPEGHNDRETTWLQRLAAIRRAATENH